MDVIAGRDFTVAKVFKCSLCTDEPFMCPVDDEIGWALMREHLKDHGVGLDQR